MTENRINSRNTSINTTVQAKPIVPLPVVENQLHFDALIAKPLLQKKDISLKDKELNQQFQKDVKSIQLIFESVYQEGFLTEEDRDDLESISSHMQEMEHSLEGERSLTKVEHDHIVAHMNWAKESIAETYQLASSLQAYYPLADQFDGAVGDLMDRTFCPLYGGESMLAVPQMQEAIKTVAHMEKQILSLPPGATKTYMAGLLKASLKELTFALEEWHDIVLEEAQAEVQKLLKSPDDDLIHAFRQKVSEMTHELSALKAPGNAFLFNDTVKSLSKMRDKLAHLQPTDSTCQWGDERWVEAHPLKVEEDKEWGEGTKRLIHAVLVGMQLTQQAIEVTKKWESGAKIREKAQKMQEDLIQAVPDAQLKEIRKEGSYLGTLLADKYHQLHDSKTYQKLTSHHPNICPILQQVLASHGSAPPNRDQIFDIIDSYVLKQSLAAAPNVSPFAHRTWEEWWEVFSTDSTPKSNSQAKPIESVRLLMKDLEHPVTAENLSERRDVFLAEINQACGILDECRKLLPQVEQGETELKKTVDLFYRELQKQAETAPPKTCSVPELKAWGQAVQEKCYAILSLEQRIARLMDPLRKATQGADLDDLGNKHKNLILQARLAGALGIPRLVVPVPRGVDSRTVTRFLEQQAPEIFQEWQKLNALFEGNPEKTFLQRPEVQDILQKIDQKLAEVFEKAGNDPDLFNQIVSPEMRAWLAMLKKNGDYLMVRSTGDEDSRQLANAGGNVSRNYVLPEPLAFARAMGDVVRSYFGIPSLQNRINNESNPFAQKLKLAVTAQQLIGEPAGGAPLPADIPISMVLFTSEPLYVGGEKFRVMRISASYGHGDGVVGNLGIASDTALLLVSEAHPDKLYVLYDNAEKPIRLAPVTTEDGTALEKVPNPSSLRNRPTLSHELLARLYHWGVVGEKFFDDYPTDMEIVVKKGVIYPVQARPVNRPDLLPTYLDLKKLSALPQDPIQTKLRGDMIVPGKASVMLLNNPEEVLCAATLEEAEKRFVKGKHQVVITSRPEPANSHPVVNFSSLGIPCLYMADTAAVESLQKKVSHSTPLVVCIQTATLNLWDKGAPAPEQYVSKGFAVHPAKIAISLPTPIQAPTIPKEVPQEVKDLLLAVRSAQTQQAGLKALGNLQKHAFVKNIKAHRRDLQGRLQNMADKPKQALRAIQSLKELDKQLQLAFDEAKQVFRNLHPSDRIRPLFHAKVIESLLISQTGVLAVEPLHQKAIAMIDYQKQLPHKAHLANLLSIGKQAFDPSFEDQWRSFLLQLEPLIENGTITPAKVQQFKDMLSMLDEMDLLENAVTFLFPASIKKFTSSKKASSNLTHETFLQLLGLASLKEIGTLYRLQTTNRSIKNLAEQLERFSDPKAYAKAFAELKDLAKSMPAKEMQALFSGSELLRLTVLQNLLALVDLYDLSIKTMKMSPDYPLDVKLTQFKEMIHAFHDVFAEWIKNQAEVYPSEKEALGRYLYFLKRAFDRVEALEELGGAAESMEASKDFNGASSLLGNLADSYSFFPKSWEDMFTLIHQNLMALIGRETRQIYTDEKIEASQLPENFKKMFSQVLAYEAGKETSCVGIEVHQNEIQVTYNVALRMHAAQLLLKFDKNTGQTVLTSRLLGPNLNERWASDVIVSQTLDELDLLSLAEPPKFNREGLTISWKIESSEKLRTALSEFRGYCDDSYLLEDRDIKQVMDTFFSRWPKDLKSILSFMKHFRNLKEDTDTQWLDYYLQEDPSLKTELLETIKMGSQSSDPEELRSALHLALALISNSKKSEKPSSLIDISKGILLNELVSLNENDINRFLAAMSKISYFLTVTQPLDDEILSLMNHLIESDQPEFQKRGLLIARDLLNRGEVEVNLTFTRLQSLALGNDSSIAEIACHVLILLESFGKRGEVSVHQINTLMGEMFASKNLEFQERGLLLAKGFVDRRRLSIDLAPIQTLALSDSAPQAEEACDILLLLLAQEKGQPESLVVISSLLHKPMPLAKKGLELAQKLSEILCLSDELMEAISPFRHSPDLEIKKIASRIFLNNFLLGFRPKEPLIDFFENVGQFFSFREKYYLAKKLIQDNESLDLAKEILKSLFEEPESYTSNLVITLSHDLASKNYPIADLVVYAISKNYYQGLSFARGIDWAAHGENLLKAIDEGLKISTPDPVMLELAIIAVEKGYGQERIATFLPSLAAKLVNENNNAFNRLFFVLAKELVSKKFGLQEVSLILQNEKNWKNEWIKDRLVNLLEPLILSGIDKGIHFQRLRNLTLAHEFNAIYIIQKLIEEDLFLDETLELVYALTPHDYGYYLLSELANQNVAPDKLMTALQGYVNDPEMRDSAIRIYPRLFSKGARGKDFRALDILIDLVETENDIKEILEPMTEDQDPQVRLQAIELASGLLDKRMATEQVMTVARRLSQDSDAHISEQARILMQKLLDGGYNAVRTFRNPTP